MPYTDPPRRGGIRARTQRRHMLRHRHRPQHGRRDPREVRGIHDRPQDGLRRGAVAGAGPDGLEYLVFGTRHPTELGWLPRSRAIRFGWRWVEGRDDDPWEVEATVEPLAVGEPSPRPGNIVNVDEVEHEEHEGLVTTAPLATRERSTLAGLHWEKIAA